MHEIIGADAEEVGFLGQLIRDEGGSRQLDHGADFDVVVVGDASVGKLLFAFLEVCVGAAEFVDLSDHRIHQPDLPVVCGAQDGAELRFEKLRLGQAEADGPAAEKRIVFAIMAGKVAELVAADVERADDYAMRGAAFGHEFVSLVLFVLGGRLGLVEEEKFGAEKTDALRPGGGDGVEFRGQLDIGRENDVLAVACG